MSYGCQCRHPPVVSRTRAEGSSRMQERLRARNVPEASPFEDAESLLRETRAITRVGSWSWDLERDLVTWSEELYRIFGVTPENFDPHFDGYLSLVHPDDRDEIHALIQASALSHEDFIFEHR